MALRKATRLGPYEVVASVGAGGMGEVYRARDSRLGREVAVKILPESLSEDPQRLHRFEQEARAAAALNHPNILAVYDLGRQDKAPYIVSELLEGETLRERLLSGPIPTRKAVDYALQLARGLAAAHDKGIVHRDLKPENIFITPDGRVKILDFGLAKLTRPDSSPDGATMAVESNAGTVVGTVGYMAPEQVRGKPADARADLFALGAILYEMLTGQRAFRGDTSADTMTAILTKDPPEFGSAHAQVSPALDRIVRHCLEKSPEERFQSARDVAFDLETLSSVSGSAIGMAAVKTSPWRRRGPLVALVPLVLLAAWVGLWAGKQATISAPLFTRLTYRGGYIVAARFSADGQTILYSAGFGGDPVQIYTTRPEATQSRELGFKDSNILAVSKNDDMLITLGHHAVAANATSGTLAQVPLTGGAPRELLEEVRYADWSPDGGQVAVVRRAGDKERLEYPLGKMLYETDGWISDARISPDGKRVAFIDHPVKFDSRGSVAMVDTQGKKTTLSRFYGNALGLAWHPSGDEVWYTASAVHLSSNLLAVTTGGKERLVWAGAGGVVLSDISKDGRVLLSRENRRRGIAGLFPGHDQEVDLSWLDWSLLYDISPDGKWITFAEEGDAAGPRYSAYMRATDGSPAIRLGDGIPTSISDDGKWVSALIPGDTYQLAILPTRAGEPRNLSAPGMNYADAFWLAGSKRLLVFGKQAGREARWWVQDISGEAPRPVTPEGATQGYLSGDKKSIIVKQGDRLTAYPIAGGQPTPVATPAPDFAWRGMMITKDPRYIYGLQERGVPQKVYRFDPASGKTELWKEFMPADKAGVFSVGPFVIGPEGKWYAYSYVRDLSDLYMVEGLK